jgi:aryl-alcohol dehydrogenase-like predicted oxidoreductase
MEIKTPIPLRSLGHTDIKITPIGLGVWQFSGKSFFNSSIWAPLKEDLSDRIVRSAWEAGINWFDTAEAYGFGNSERALSSGLQAAGIDDPQVVVATKWFPLLRFAGNIRRTIDTRIANLKPYTIDLYQIHNTGSLSSIQAQMNAMADLVQAGQVRSVGVSNFSAEQMRQAHQYLAQRGLSLASNQVKYSVIDRVIERNGILDAARELGITIIAYSPLEMGLLTGKFHKDVSLLESRPRIRRARLQRQLDGSRQLVDTLEEIGQTYKASPSQVALNWLIHAHGETVVAIPGASKVKHAEESAGAIAFRLTDDEIRHIDALSRKQIE